MSIWFYLFLIVLCLLVWLVLKVMIIKNEMKFIRKSLFHILKSDTNRLLTIHSRDKDLKDLAAVLNVSLKKLRELEMEYKNGNQELKTSITNISHDLRTPLTAIRGYLDLMDAQNLTEKQLNYLRIIESKVKDLIELSEQLFDFSKSVDVQNEMKREYICINDVLEDTIASFYSLLKEYNITPNIDICKEKVIRLLNENMLKRIFENILSNAIKYGEQSIDIKMDCNGTIEFSNQTEMMDSVSLENIFERYYTVQSVKKATGIGLSIAKQLVELCNGTIDATYQNHLLTIIVQF